MDGTLPGLIERGKQKKPVNPGTSSSFSFPPRIIIDLLLVWYVYAVLLVPDLVVGRILQGLTSILSTGLDEVTKRRISVGEFCRRVNTVRGAYGKMGRIFRYNILVLVAVCLIQTIVESYFILSRLFGPTDPDKVLASLRNAVFVVIAVKRLMHLTGLVHGLQEQVEVVEEKLVDFEVCQICPKDIKCGRFKQLVRDKRSRCRARRRPSA